MTYSPRPNASGDTLVDSRDQIRTNFELIRDQFQENHVNISNNGKHKFVQLPEVGSDPGVPSTAVDEGAVYTKDVGGITQLFFRGENNGTEYQLTSAADGVDPSVSEFGTNTVYQAGPPALSGGWTYLPGGLLLQYGSFTGLTPNVEVTFPKAFSSFVASITVTNQTNADRRVWVLKSTPPSVTNFRAAGQFTSADTYMWMAIGK